MLLVLSLAIFLLSYREKYVLITRCAPLLPLIHVILLLSSVCFAYYHALTVRRLQQVVSKLTGHDVLPSQRKDNAGYSTGLILLIVRAGFQR